MIDIINKANIIMSFFKLLKEHKFLRVLFVLGIIISGLFCYGLSMIKDNSIYVDSKEDHEIREAIKSILIKCGDGHAIGLSTISTETESEYYAKFKEIFSCDKSLNPNNCLVDLSSDKFPFAGDYIVDKNTYKLLLEISNSEDVKKIYVPQFEAEEFPTINGLLEKSIHYKNGSVKNLFLTASQNNERNLIYALHLLSWANTDCSDAKYLLNKFRNKLPKSK